MVGTLAIMIGGLYAFLSHVDKCWIAPMLYHDHDLIDIHIDDYVD